MEVVEVEVEVGAEWVGAAAGAGRCARGDPPASDDPRHWTTARHRGRKVTIQHIGALHLCLPLVVSAHKVRYDHKKPYTLSYHHAYQPSSTATGAAARDARRIRLYTSLAALHPHAHPTLFLPTLYCTALQKTALRGPQQPPWRHSGVIRATTPANPRPAAAAAAAAAAAVQLRLYVNHRLDLTRDRRWCSTSTHCCPTMPWCTSCTS